MNIIHKVSSSKYFKQVFTLSAGTVAAQLITLSAYVFVARLYDQSEFGAFKLFESISILIAFISTLSFEHAIVLPAKRSASLGIFKLSILFLCVTNIIALITIFVFDDIILRNTNFEVLTLYLLPLSSSTIGLIGIFGNWFVHKKDYKNLSIGKVIQSFFTSVIQISIGLINSINSGLIVGYVAGRFLSTVFFSYKSTISLKEALLLKYERLKATFENYVDQPKFVLPSKLIQQVSVEIPVFLTVLFFNDTLLGYLALSMKGLSTPTQFIGISVGQVFYKQIADRYNNKEALQPFILKTWLGLSVVGIVPFTLLMIWGPEIFSFVFGSGWSMTGQIAAVLSPAIFLYFIIGPTERAVFLVLNKQSRILYFSVIDLILKCSAFFVGHYYDNFILVVQLMSLFQIITMSILALYILRISSKYNHSNS